MAISALTLSSVDEQIKLLGVAPQIVPRLQQLLIDANTNPDDILDLIKLDTALASKVIRTSNSAYFSRGIEVSCIEDAVTYLGYDEVYRIMSLLAFARMMKAPLRHFGLGPGDLWRRSLACALAMEGVAKTTGFDSRTAYTIGLLHAVGMVFVDHQLALNKAETSAARAPEEDVKLLGLTHAEVGAYVLRQWNFPETIVEPVRGQFNPLDSTSHATGACVLNTGKCIAKAATESLPEGATRETPDPVVMTMIDLTEDDYGEILVEIEGKFALLEIAASE